MTSVKRLTALLMLLFSLHAHGTEELAPNQHPVKTIADARIAVGDKGLLPLFVSRDWTTPQPEISRAVIVLHGRLRDADVYYRSARKAQEAAADAGRAAIMIVPQFLAQADIDAFNLPDNTLRWTWDGWEGGDDATAPSAVSSFEALDAILPHLADRKLFPNLKQVVVAGHSGGAQVVQRYAIAGRGEARLTKEGVAVRYVVANPSSYAYFSSDRPAPVIAATCSRFDDWKYGMKSRPPYLAHKSPVELERTYVARRVIYLLGTLDTNPQHPALDRSCMAETQGPYRYARGHAYFEVTKARNAGAPNHSLLDVDGVGHDGDKMLTSPCGLQALFDVPGCAERK